MAGCWDAAWNIWKEEITAIIYKHYLPFFCKTEGRQRGLEWGGPFYDWDKCKTKREVGWNDAEHLGESGRLTYTKTGSGSIRLRLSLSLSLLLGRLPSSHSCSHVARLPFSFPSVRERTTYFAKAHACSWDWARRVITGLPTDVKEKLVAVKEYRMLSFYGPEHATVRACIHACTQESLKGHMELLGTGAFARLRRRLCCKV